MLDRPDFARANRRRLQSKPLVSKSRIRSLEVHAFLSLRPRANQSRNLQLTVDPVTTDPKGESFRRLEESRCES
jgi:hypothetical protein